MRLIDTHCHPQMGAYDGDRQDMLSRAFADGIGCIAVGTTLTDSLAGIRLVESFSRQPIWAAIGVHPTDDDIDEVRIEDLEVIADHSRVVAIGECGLDYFHLKHEDEQQLQIDLFEQHIVLAQRLQKPLIVHCRDRVGVYDAYDDVATLLKKHNFRNFVMHCFSGDEVQAENFLELGGYLSFTGIITFPKSELMQAVVKTVPADRYMVETDAPFLTPVPFRGQRNEPAHVAWVAKSIADLRGTTVEDVAQQTTRNAVTFFGLEKSS